MYEKELIENETYKKLGTTMIATIIAMGMFSLPVSAHVTVKPATSDVGSWEAYTIKVPVEKM